LRRVIRRENPDVIHAHLMHPNLLSRLAGIGGKIPVINTIHTAEKRKGKGGYFLLDRLTWKWADCVTAVSGAAASYHRQVCRLKRGVNIRVIPNAVEPVVPAPEELCALLREQWCPGGADKVIGCTGRLDAMKGFDLMLDRLEPLTHLIPDGEKWLLVVLGDGPDREKLERKAAQLRYENLKIVFAGFRSDAASLMNLFDVFFTPSRCEGYGLAVAEAMTLGLPVVCNRIDALPELCEVYDGDSFLFHLEEDTDGMEMAAQLLSAASCERSAGMILMSQEKMVQSYRRLYDALLRRRKK
ncbi:MAG: glycosyltransferase, partial [Lentisphaeria bacterium]|nr:glycosyltransferase [Lentisphaeria bacterium]